MTTKHPHHDIITAYLEGKAVQIRFDPKEKWKDIVSLKDLDWKMPQFQPEWEYRLKPVLDYRMVVIQSNFSVIAKQAEHWERPNAIFSFNAETGNLESVEVL